jgi:hypothetical protein
VVLVHSGLARQHRHQRGATDKGGATDTAAATDTSGARQNNVG